ncbi:hypothetical protein [Dyella telluris]|uniref:Uncharacterized protein n=1 Tax=Dyella telluris TaxID=2763498 RepID=A0A7G8Q5Q0_9GAMM|nr:hypothetical protein [Dyella telluris]QNK02108.1 hypothetical protein H8F01_02790 [Dyella telluris]
MERCRVWASACLLAFAATAAVAQDDCDHRPFGAVVKQGVENPPDANDKWFPVDDHQAAPRPSRGLTLTSWGWGCSTTLIVDLDRARAAEIHRCSEGSSDYDALWARFAKRAQLVTHRVVRNKFEQWEALETRPLDKGDIAAFTCLANKAWSAPPPKIPEGAPVPPHSVSYVRLWDGRDVKFFGGYTRPESTAGDLLNLVYGWFRP